jgi:heat shock protein HslJ
MGHEENRLNGNGGCNSFTGHFELKPGNRLAFSKIAATLMACPDMQIETQLIEALETADHYSLLGDTLTLNKARMAPLARFEAVNLR